MKQEKIKYSDIVRLKFKEEVCDDHVYFDQYGFEYVIITKDLTDTISLDWEKHSQLCELIRVDNPESGNIQSKMPISNLKQLEEIIDFFGCTEDSNGECFSYDEQVYDVISYESLSDSFKESIESVESAFNKAKVDKSEEKKNIKVVALESVDDDDGDIVITDGKEYECLSTHRGRYCIIDDSGEIETFCQDIFKIVK